MAPTASRRALHRCGTKSHQDSKYDKNIHLFTHTPRQTTLYVGHWKRCTHVLPNAAVCTIAGQDSAINCQGYRSHALCIYIYIYIYIHIYVYNFMYVHIRIGRRKVLLTSSKFSNRNWKSSTVLFIKNLIWNHYV